MKAWFALGLAAAGIVLPPAHALPTEHPHVLLTRADVTAIRQGLGHAPRFDAAIASARAQIDPVLTQPLQLPVPKDAAGYTHERHKRNYVEMQLAGFLYQVTGDAKYADFVKRMLLGYAELYPTLGRHPAGKGNSAGRLFWQTLNEAVWLVNTSQAYDCVYDTLTSDERSTIETKVFRPMARFFSEERVGEFDRIHNHGTWADTAVGMIGYALGDETLVKKALYGSKMDGTAGYFRQLDELFSPDGYYCEGPYYARYALMPFFLFAHAIQNNQPELGVFGRRHEVLRQAVYALLQQTDVNGAFIPFNDALKEKNILTDETVLAVDVAYAHYGHDPRLLSIAQRQQGVYLGVAGLEVAEALARTPHPPPFPYASVEFRDGPQGEAGGVGILRSGVAPDQSLALLKYTSFGMEHGHYDKLGLIYYDQAREIIPDYGSARFLNVDQKDGGRYLTENGSFAKQTIAHNTIVVDERSDYAGSFATADRSHSERQFFDAHDPDFQVMSAVDRTAYPGVALQRTVAMVRDQRLAYPVVLDVLRAASTQPHRYDYPFYYAGQFLAVNGQVTPHTTTRPVLGPKAGYQHLWVTADGVVNGPLSFDFMNGERYYTITSATDANTHVYFLQVGANDPNFDLRNENALMLREDGQAEHVFASVIEPHGTWDGVKEQTFGGRPQLTGVSVVAADAQGTVVRVTGVNQLEWTVMIANAQPAKPGHHRVTAGAETFEWDGDAAIRRR